MKARNRPKSERQLLCGNAAQQDLGFDSANKGNGIERRQYMKREYSIETNERKIYPLGVTKTPGGFDVAFVSEKSPALLLFEKGSRKRMARLAFPENARMGNVHFMTVKGDFTGLEYAFEEDGKEISDPFGTCFTGREKWGDEKAAGQALHTPFEAVKEAFDWEDDKRPEIPANECIVYKIHPRGFSKHVSFKGESWKRGTFGAVIDKIPYSARP